MRHRFARPRALLLLPLLAAAAACRDESPTLTGEENFPGGSRPVTREVIVPASEYLATLGVYTGFAGPGDFPFEVLANDYEGLFSNALLRFAFPAQVAYSQDGVSRTDTEYRVRSARLVAVGDSAASSGAGTLRLNLLAESFHPATATWTVAVDTTGERRLWAAPGGTPGAQLGQATYTPGASGDSVVIALDSAAVAALRADTLRGGLLRVVESGRRVQLTTVQLVAQVRPSNAVRDTTIEITLTPTSVLVFTPEPPQPAGVFQAGGVRAARTVFSVNLDRTVPGCAAGETCADIPLGEVQLNRVSLLLRPVDTPGGFDPLETVPLTLYTVDEPELGRLAPLGRNVLDLTNNGQVAAFAPGDTLVEVPFTGYATLAADADSLSTTFALLGEAPPSTVGVPRTFGVALFESTPRLRIVYTLPIRPRLP